jgi:hypothetical protein
LEVRGLKIPWVFNLPYRGGQFSIRGFNIPWMKIDLGVNLSWDSKYHMTPGTVIPMIFKISKFVYHGYDIFLQIGFTQIPYINKGLFVYLVFSIF